MERRFIQFVFLAACVLVSLQLIKAIQDPPKPPQEDPDALAELDPEKAEIPGGEQPDGEADPDRPPGDLEADETHPPSLVSLGSIDHTTGHNLLVTLDSRGAAVRRVELASPRFLSYEHEQDGGYLGHLSVESLINGGAQVRVVGHGTPAFQAKCTDGSISGGLAAGDILRAIDGAEIRHRGDLELVLATTEPGQTVKIELDRPEAVAAGEESAVDEGDNPPAKPATRSLTFDVTLGQHPVEIIKPESTLSQDAAEGEMAMVSHPAAFLTTLARVGEKYAGHQNFEIRGIDSLFERDWKTTVVSENEVHFEAIVEFVENGDENNPHRLRLIKKYRLPDPVPGDNPARDEGYHINYSLEIHNDGDQVTDVAYRQMGPSGLPLEGYWYAHKIHRGWSGAGVRDVTWEARSGSPFEMFTVASIVSRAENKDGERETLMFSPEDAPLTRYAGVDAQYFNCSLLFDHEESTRNEIPLTRGSALPIGPIDTQLKRRTNVSYKLDSRVLKIAPGHHVAHEFRIFAGPKLPALLENYGLENVDYYGWFGFVSRPLLFVLHTLYIPLQNYGLAIILLTVMVRGAMYPISRKQTKNMQLQAQLAPELKKLRDMYKDQPEKMASAQSALFKKYNFNPVGGCGMMFLQLPIFLGLYRGLAVDINLRQAPLIPGVQWCSNLSAPDQLWRWDHLLPSFLAGPEGWLGPFLNILPLVTVVLFLIQQKLFMPPPQDEQQKMQQQVMTFMMLFIGVMFFRVPSGLCIYFITSSIWGIVERKLLPQPKKVVVDPLTVEPDTQAKKAKVRTGASTRKKKQK
ncbi:MAG: YidC/Oxa1 family insertase periplasmic-domain containing protein [Pirellulaceae bacterium]